MLSSKSVLTGLIIMILVVIVMSLTLEAAQAGPLRCNGKDWRNKHCVTATATPRPSATPRIKPTRPVVKTSTPIPPTATLTPGVTCHWYAPPCPAGQYCAAIVYQVCD